MKLENLRVAVLGDSITQGVGVADPKSCYHALLAEKYHWNATVDGISGTRIAPQEKVWDWEEPRMKEDFCGRVKNLPQDADLLIFFGGTNDFGHGDTPFGAWGDHKPSTFCGAVFSMMRPICSRRCSSDFGRADAARPFAFRVALIELPPRPPIVFTCLK